MTQREDTAKKSSLPLIWLPVELAHCFHFSPGSIRILDGSFSVTLQQNQDFTQNFFWRSISVVYSYI
jgi:hypothetical protein